MVISTRATRLVLWCAFLGAGLWLVHLSGAVAPSPPVSARPATIRAWASSVESAEAVVGVVRLMSLALLWYLTAVTIAAGLSRACGRLSWATTIERLTPPALRELLTQGRLWTAAGLTVASTPILAASLAIPEGASPDPHTDAPAINAPGFESPAGSGVDPAASPNAATPSSSPSPKPTSPQPVPRPTELAGSAGATIQNPLGAHPTAGDPPDTHGDPRTEPDGTPDTWTVEPGDHFWRIAEEVVEEATGAQAPVRAVASYWVELVEANRRSLVDPANPDLIYPGQVFVLPPVSSTGAQPTGA